ELSASVLILPWAAELTADVTARDDTFRVAAAARVAVRGDVDAEPPVLTVVVATRGAQAPEVHDLDGLALAGRRDHREIVCARGVPLGAAGVHDRLLVHQGVAVGGGHLELELVARRVVGAEVALVSVLEHG